VKLRKVTIHQQKCSYISPNSMALEGCGSSKTTKSDSSFKKGKKGNRNHARKNNVVVEHIEIIRQLHHESSRSSFIGIFSSITLAIVVLSVIVVATIDVNWKDISRVSDFRGVFVHGSDVPTTSRSSGYPGSRSAPNICRDGVTYGYSDWNSLRLAIEEANSFAESLGFSEDLDWIMDESGVLTPPDPPPLPEPFIICSGATLKGSNRKGPIFINSEDIMIQCESCIIDGKGTHFAFGKNAKRTTIKGITFVNAKTTSLTFYHHGAEVALEDCIWEKNAGIGQLGAVADLNSTRLVRKTFSIVMHGMINSHSLYFA